MSRTVTVKAVPWRGGWELHLDDRHCTQSRTLAEAEQQVRDYLDTDSPEENHNDWTIVVVPRTDGHAEAMEDRRL